MTKDSLISRRNLLQLGAFTALSPALRLNQESTTCPVICNPKPPTCAAEALQALIAGNEKWATFTQCHPHEDAKRRTTVAKGQSPFAAILSCSDSRVPPELVFDQGVGDLFVARVAGNCAGGTLTESLYYGTKEQYLGALILFVLGHTECGAVKAAVESYPGNTFQFAELIYPAVEAARAIVGPPYDEYKVIPVATEQNVILGVNVLREDPELQGLLIAGGVYDLGVGGVNNPESWRVKILIQ
ncbi:MAG: carbonic anhydrase [Candidatus Acidiferrales bacterium]|jgi:carbonic anhydrase